MEHKKEVTLERVAAEVGVSIVTVSNALNGKKGVSEDMRRKVREAAERLGYRYRTAAKTGSRSYKIGVAVAERHVKEFPSFYMEIYQSAAQELTLRGSMAFLKVLSEERQERTEKATLFQGVDIDGILLIGETDKGCAAELKKVYQVPVVCVGSYDISEEADSIVPDCYGGMEQVTELLLEAGHTELVFVGSPEEGTNAADCYLGFCKAMEKRELEANIVKLPQPDRTEKKQTVAEADFSRIQPDAIGCDSAASAGVRPDAIGCDSAASVVVRPEAFVCDSAVSAEVLLERLQKQGIRVPQDVSVAGFGKYFSSQSEWKLTTYVIDEKEIAHLGVAALIEQLEGQRQTGRVRIVEGRLIQGNTVGQAICKSGKRKAGQCDGTGKAGHTPWEM